MPELNLSPDFTVEDIHKLRLYHYEMTKDMTVEERKAYDKKRELSGKEFQKKIDALRAARLEQENGQ